ncbi:hypothetical protein MUK42_25724 [Musa troglodytarum]|uniref:Uncharacterized protein n=1 Tax=Musa troglodytarum TaxID=320322 RepID=A0A9E7FN51_9LILI|nr:hypothetical protein MUK42_25724 [Musa troglodytarum]
MCKRLKSESSTVLAETVLGSEVIDEVNVLFQKTGESNLFIHMPTLPTDRWLNRSFSGVTFLLHKKEEKDGLLWYHQNDVERGVIIAYRRRTKSMENNRLQRVQPRSILSCMR